MKYMLTRMLDLLWVWVLIAILAYELGSIHRHLHEIECKLGNTISDRDGTVWKECPNAPLSR